MIPAGIFFMTFGGATLAVLLLARRIGEHALDIYRLLVRRHA